MNEQDYKIKYETLKKEFHDFVYIISHDLKAPLRAIQNITEWIEEDLADGKVESVTENFSDLKQRANHLNNMIDALSKISRIETRSNEIGELNVLFALNELKESLEFEFKNLTLEIDSPEINFSTYPQKFNQVIVELIENSAKHNQELKNLKVTVKVIDSDDFINIELKDNGCGIESAYLEKIFDLFYTTKSKDEFYTTGVGLTFVKKIMDFIGGAIKGNPSANGTSFTINWPKKI